MASEHVPAQQWEPENGVYGKVHLIAGDKSICGLQGEWFTAYAKIQQPSPTCKKCCKGDPNA
jgi:hypothetical protein